MLIDFTTCEDTALIIRVSRAILGITQKKYGELVGATGYSIGSWERGDSEPTYSKVEKILRLLEQTKYQYDD